MARLFKKDLQVPVEAIIKEMVPVLIVTAVLKGQTELLFQLCEQASKEIRKTNVQTRAEVFAQMITVFDRTGNNLRKQLAHIATTEVDDDTYPFEVASLYDFIGIVHKDKPKYLVVSDLSLLSQDFRSNLKKEGYTLIESDSKIFNELMEKIHEST